MFIFVTQGRSALKWVPVLGKKERLNKNIEHSSEFIKKRNALAQANDGLTTYEAVCKRCHGSLEEQKSSLEAPIIPVVMLPLGPDLKGVFGRPAGIVKGFQYSKGMKAFAKKGAIWDRTTLDLFLTDSRKLVPGSFMFIKVPESQRTPLIDYLEKVAPYRP